MRNRRGLGRQFRRGRLIAEHDDASAETVADGDAIHPGDRMAIRSVVRCQQLEGMRQVSTAQSKHLAPCTRYTAKTNRNVRDVSGQPHSTDSRAKNGSLLPF